MLHILVENFSGVVEYSVRCLRKGICGHLLSFAVPIVGLGIGKGALVFMGHMRLHFVRNVKKFNI